MKLKLSTCLGWNWMKMYEAILWFLLLKMLCGRRSFTWWLKFHFWVNILMFWLLRFSTFVQKSHYVFFYIQVRYLVKFSQFWHLFLYFCRLFLSSPSQQQLLPAARIWNLLPTCRWWFKHEHMCRISSCLFIVCLKTPGDVSHLVPVLMRIHFWWSNTCQGLYLALRIQFALHLIQCLSPSNRTGCLPQRLLIGIECTVIFSNINQYSPNLPQHILDAHYCLDGGSAH